MGAILPVQAAFDQRRTTSVLPGLRDRICEFARRRGFQPETMAFSCIEHIDQPGIVPVLDVVVRAVMDLDLDDIARLLIRKMMTGSS